MEITDIILVTENYKGTEKNMLMNFTEYMIQFGMQTGKTPSEAAFHTLDLERSKNDRGMWTEVYFSANKNVNARYCIDMDQLCYFYQEDTMIKMQSIILMRNDARRSVSNYWTNLVSIRMEVIEKVQNLKGIMR